MTRSIVQPDVWKGLQVLDDRVRALERLTQSADDRLDILESNKFVTTLPDQPDDGDIIYYQADATKGAMWSLRYRQFASDGVTANASAYRWECIGGPALILDVATSSAVPGGAYSAQTGSLTAPLSGDYEISHGGTLTNPGNNLPEAVSVSVTYSVAAASGLEAIEFNHANSAASWSSSLARTFIRTVASGSVFQQYTSSVNGADTIKNRFISIRPIRVG